MATNTLLIYLILGLGYYAFQIAYYAFEQCSKIFPIMLHMFIKLLLPESENMPIFQNF